MHHDAVKSRDSGRALAAATFATWLAAFVAPLFQRRDTFSSSSIVFWALLLVSFLVSCFVVFAPNSQLLKIARFVLFPALIMLSPWAMENTSNPLLFVTAAGLLTYFSTVLRSTPREFEGEHVPLEKPAIAMTLPHRFTFLFVMAFLIFVPATLVLDLNQWPDELRLQARLLLITSAFSALIATITAATIALSRPLRKAQYVPARLATRLIIATVAFGLFIAMQSFS